jgi:hypothetical protein
MNNNFIAISVKDNVLVVDSRLVAERLGVGYLQAEYSFLPGIMQKPFLDALDILAIASHISTLRCIYTYETASPLPDLLELAEKLSENNSAFRVLKMAVISQMALEVQGLYSERSSVQGWFEKNFKTYFPEAELVNAYSVDQKRPDCILNISGTHYPVECKLDFSERGLAQLTQYMKLWKVDRGIAVAHKFSVKMPEFISAIEVALC